MAANGPREQLEAESLDLASRTRPILAWGVHLLTASGLICFLLAIEAGVRGNWRPAFAWLAVATLIDAVDGGLARIVRVKEVLPSFDGSLLDNLIDFVGYVFVPAFFLHHAKLLPPQYSLWVPATVCLASAFQFCQADAKTADHYFKGFPSYWNIAVLYLLALQLKPGVNIAIVVVLIALVFLPIKYVYPSRTPEFRALTLVLTSLWGGAMFVIIMQLPQPATWLVWASLLYVGYYLGMSLYLTRRSREESS
jgi:phosphatidylcholine synthase